MADQTDSVIYCRTASKTGNDDPHIASQEMECRAYAGLYGLKVRQVYADDGVSGMSFQRPGLDAMLAALEADPSLRHVITLDMARLGKDLKWTHDLVGRLQDMNKTVHFLSADKLLSTQTQNRKAN
ncbi:MAG: recombinase family protein [Rhodospirillales bacterium]|nr:recombinase family protein [Rhodospirillales bacterium]